MTKTRLLALISLILLSFVVARTFFDEFGPNDRKLDISEVRELSDSRTKARPVHFRGVVTLAGDSFLVVQDSTAGIRVRLAQPLTSPIYSHLVEVDGTTPVGPGEDAINQATYRDLGESQLPTPQALRGDDFESSRLDGMLVTLRGITCPGHFKGQDEILFHLRMNGAVVQVRVRNSEGSNARTSFANTDVEFTGVASTSLDVNGKITNLQLLVPGIRSAAVKSARLDFRNLPVHSVAEVRSGDRSLSSLPFHLQGRLREAANAQGLELSDATGSIALRVVDGSGYSQSEVDVVGFLNHEGSLLILDEAVVLGTNATGNSEPTLTTVDSVKRLPVDQARLKKPVTINAIVTYNDPIRRLLFVQDSTGGIYCGSNDLTDKLVAGDAVKITGVTGPGDFAPLIAPTEIEIKSRNAKLPEPGKFTDEDIFGGQADSELVEMEGIVHDNQFHSGQFSLLIAHGGYRFRFLMSGKAPMPASWINARVRVRGVCTSHFNSRRQILGIQILGQNTLGQNGEQVTILQPSLEGPFDEPATPIAKLATFMVGQKAGYRLHLHGSVLATERGGPTWIRDATGAVTIRDHSDLTLTPGDDVDVAGFVVSGNSAPEIENAEVRRNGAGAPPQPIAITTDEALSGERNAQLVQLDARVLDQLHNGSDRVLVVQTGWQTFAVRSKAPLPSLDIGSIVRLSGICVSSGSTTNSPSFELVLRSPSDLTLLRRAPWLTSDRAYRALGILALLSLVASIWVAILRRRVNRQTRIISQKLVEVEALKERAESGSRAKSEFLANISHEIRTPMNGILGMTELALEQNIEPPLRDTLSMVKTSADSLLSIVNNILDLSKVEAGKLELEPLECCLRDCLEESVCVLAARAHSKGLEMICNLHSQLPELVLTDESRLRQILTNLLGNAIKFTDQGEVELIVYPETIRDDVATIHFAVRDTGIGIATEKQTLIFSAFTQADASTTRLYGGSGLGLSIASQLVNLLGGRIWVESQPGVGSTFHFVAPFKVLASRSANDNPGDDRWAGTEVLIIESNACSAKVLSQLLGTWQINATIANSVKSAEDLVRRRGETFGLVIGESQPKSREFSEIKLVLLVPRGKLPCGDGRNEHNFAGHLAKPILRREVWAVVNGALSNGKYARTEVADSLVDAEPSGHRLQVLVVEDNRINQLVARRLIERNGCEVALAGSGHEAVEALAANAYDVVFMDIQMPEMDGLEVTQQIRRTEQGSGRHQYIVAMTAHAMESDRERCLAAGMDDYLSKPVQPAQLKAILESVGLRAQSARASALT